MNDDLVKLLKYELGDSPSIEKKAERLAQRFYEPDNFASKNRTIYHAVLSRLLEEPNQGGMRTKIGSQKFSGNYNSGLNAAGFARSRRQGVPGYVLLLPP
jgi:hypothetical protein